MCNERILCAGFGGQGVMSLGQLLAYAAMFEDKNVTWIPSYGPEMRGGTAYCSVVISSDPVGSPLITGNATCTIVMNLPSLVKFEESVAPGGILLINSSLVNESSKRKDIRIFDIPAIELAGECGSEQAANMVMLGAYLGLSNVVQVQSIGRGFKKVFGKKATKLLPLNLAAIDKGMACVLASDVLAAA